MLMTITIKSKIITLKLYHIDMIKLRKREKNKFKPKSKNPKKTSDFNRIDILIYSKIKNND